MKSEASIWRRYSYIVYYCCKERRRLSPLILGNNYIFKAFKGVNEA